MDTFLILSLLFFRLAHTLNLAVCINKIVGLKCPQEFFFLLAQQGGVFLYIQRTLM